MQDDRDNGEFPSSVTPDSSIGESQLPDEPTAFVAGADGGANDDADYLDSDGGQSTYDAAEEAARDSRTFQVADHGIALTPVPPAPARPVRDTRVKSANEDAAKTSDRFTFRDFFLWCGVPVLIVLLARIFLVGFYEIPSRSMMDTIVPGDRVIASKLTPSVFDLQRGDVVVFKDPDNWLTQEQSNAVVGNFLIKRLIGMPGDVVECEGAGKPITVNGVAIDESAYIRPGVDPSAFPFSVKVTEGHVFVMGDNRANSADSRYHQDDSNHGLVPINDVVGTGLVTYWPLNRIGVLQAHHDVFKDVPDASGSAS